MIKTVIDELIDELVLSQRRSPSTAQEQDGIPQLVRELGIDLQRSPACCGFAIRRLGGVRGTSGALSIPEA
ncbi:MAG: hypothetical protein JO115_06730 [Pseudonocardiales bacterium]|nr:hypothetical protein [Pseudonocardiales bacterium]